MLIVMHAEGGVHSFIIKKEILGFLIAFVYRL